MLKLNSLGHKLQKNTVESSTLFSNGGKTITTIGVADVIENDKYPVNRHSTRNLELQLIVDEMDPRWVAKKIHFVRIKRALQ